MKRQAAAWLAAILLMLPTLSLAAGRVTPSTPMESESREAFSAWVETELAPWIRKADEGQWAKWSAQRCKEVVKKTEDAGFAVGSKWKTLLYGTKREHRLHASEAFHWLLQSQYGEEWEWTVEEHSWGYQMAVDAGIYPSNAVRGHTPTPADGTTQEALQRAYQTICPRYAVTDEQWDAYDLSVSFLSAGNENGGVDYFWEILVMKDWENHPYETDFALRIFPATGEITCTDERPDKP